MTAVFESAEYPRGIYAFRTLEPDVWLSYTSPRKS
jgi:hypothetical protein